ncbi:MAG TPA: MFS transporter [bacterium]|nr:MFS transporter [bacterium]HPN35473.1 MFS transporter [bacterium]
MPPSENDKPQHSSRFRIRRFLNWFPLGLTYAFLYMARYNLTVSKNALGELMSKADFGVIFGAGTLTYAFAFLLNGPLTDRIGGKRAILLSAAGAAAMNLLMGLLTFYLLTANARFNLVLWFSLLYSLNMYFQSFGAVAIVKVNASWFHIRERGVFGGIFGILISLGLYFAFDWGQMIVDATVVNPQNLNFVQRLLRSLLAMDNAALDQTWWVFFVPAVLLGVFFLLDLFVLRDRPSQAGFADFNTGDAGSDEAEQPLKTGQIIKRVLTSKILLTIAFIELCSGVLRNGIMHWYLIFAADMGYGLGFFITKNWGLLLMLAGVFGGMFAGWVSDKVFGSRRGPVAALLYALMLISTLVMWPFVHSTSNAVKQGMTLTLQPEQIKRFQTHQVDRGMIEKTLRDQGYGISVSAQENDWRLTHSNGKKMAAAQIGNLVVAEYQRFNPYQNKQENIQIQIRNLGRLHGADTDTRALALGLIVVLMSLCVIGVHGMLSGTSTMDFGGRRAAATAVGLIDGFVYLGTGIQSMSLGFLTSQNWSYWPPFLVPFAVLGLALSIKIWHAFPDSKRSGH